VGGAADPGGAWTYGQLEVFDGETFVGVSDASREYEELGRRGAQVACRTLGFVTGGQALAGTQSALPDADGRDSAVGRIVCNGDEATLSDCKFDDYVFLADLFSEYEGNEDDEAVALVCSNPTGARSCLLAMLDSTSCARRMTWLSCGYHLHVHAVTHHAHREGSMTQPNPCDTAAQDVCLRLPVWAHRRATYVW